ncbi:four-carbon acid sugar kinase family protein [Kineococcus auxinigenes]|uniref:four-carbon acid sugar kinase family protein n=1 Tax=unclassified Kineococcus TaxID=2621656 RepID=UPI003D7D84B8
MSRSERGHDAAAPPEPPTEPVLLAADDLSGAAEAALAHGGPSTLLLDPGIPTPATDILVLDLHCRTGSAEAAADGLRRALTRHATGPGGHRRRVALKVDSLLRGHLAAAVAGALATGAPVVLAPALPVAGRTVRGGVVHVDGVPLHRTGAWHAEPTVPPVSVAAALGAVPAHALGLDAVRSPTSALAAAFAAAAARGAVVVCDGTDAGDLDAVVRAATAVGAVLVGSAGVVAALGRSRPAPRAAAARQAAPPAGGDVLVVVGTAAPGARAQLHALRRAGARVVELSEDPAATPRALRAGLRGGCAALTLPPGPVEPARSRHLVGALADAARAAVTAHPTPLHLALTGGETARAVLDALGVRVLEPLRQVHHGAVVSRAPGGRLVATRPGSFGDAGSLLALARALGALPGTPAPHLDAVPERQEIPR